MLVGIDVGSSRCKVAVLDPTGHLRCSVSRRSPPDLYESGYELWPFVQDVVCDLVRQCIDPSEITGVGVSSVAPSLVSFTSSGKSPQVMFSHLTPVQTRHSQGPDLPSRLAFRRGRTDARLAATRGRTDGKPKGFLPLASAIGLLLTGTIQLDVISAYELGFATLAELAEFCDVARVAKYRSTPALAELPTHAVLVTTTDTCASLLVGGVRRSGDGLLYYGTYHCALELAQPMESCLFADTLTAVPYYWRVSLPRYGMILERLLHALSADTPSERVWAAFEEALARGIRAQAFEPTIAVEPRLPGVVTSDTFPMIDVRNISLSVSFDEFAMALATPFARALRTAHAKGALDNVHHWFAAGGGSVNRALLGVTSAVTGIRQRLQRDAATAAGAAQLALLRSRADTSLPSPAEGILISPDGE